MGRRAKAAKGKSGAKRARARKPTKNDDAKLAGLEKRLAEALDQQAATAEILRAISGSRTDVPSVLNVVAENAARLCHVEDVSIIQADGGIFRVLAYRGAPRLKEFEGTPVTRGSVAGRAILDRRVVHVPDVTELSEAEFSVSQALVEHFGHSTMLATPLLREGRSIGAIFVRRTNVRPFSDREIELLQTFADHAIIAIENVRLFNETQEALEQQTATSEILRVISRSPTDVQPVFDTIADRAMRLCDGRECSVFRFDGELIHLAALAHVSARWAGALRGAFPRPPGRGSMTARAILTRSIVHVPDCLTDPEYELTEAARASGNRSVLAVPMIRDGEVVGAITVSREEPRPFTKKQIEVVTTFTDQAVIAIENVRLFTELQQRNEAVTQAHTEVSETLERQTATSEVLRVIAGSPTDLQPVLDALVRSASRLCQTADTFLLLVEGDRLRVVARTVEEGGLADSIHRGWVAGRAVVDAQTIHVEDLSSAGAEFPRGAEIAARLGHRTALALPLFGKGLVIGTLFLRRQKVQRFSDKEIALLQTFADQAVIAIENVRLFTELQARTGELTRSVEKLMALGEVGQAVSSSLDLKTVLTTIVSRAVQLSGLDGGVVFEYDEATERFMQRAAIGTANRATAAHEGIRRGEGVVGRMALTLQPVQIPDIAVAGAYESRIREDLIAAGVRALVAVPIMREGRLVGGLAVNRKQPGEVSPDTVELLQTFAAQSALAIQNARLFLEIEDKSRQLEVASRHKSEFLASMSHELRTPLNGILGFNEMILDEVYGEIPPDLREPLTEIQNSGRHLLRLINNVLDLSKIEAGRMELALGDYAVQDTVAQVRASLHALAADKGLEFVTAVPADLPLAHGDAGRIAQCLTNLAGNAIKFTRQGRVEIAVELEGELVVYRVSDTGIGIEPDRMGTLFTEFRQADPTIASEFGGSGLGLSITRKFAEMHGGRVWVESEPGRGSRFFLAVPLRVGGGAPA
jgi:GAF domain-containing protein